MVWSCANAAPLEESAAKHATPFAASRARRARPHKSTATRRGSASFFGCEARDGCPPLALEEEEDEARAKELAKAEALQTKRFQEMEKKAEKRRKREARLRDQERVEKQERHSPSSSITAVMQTAIIQEEERRDVAEQELQESHLLESSTPGNLIWLHLAVEDKAEKANDAPKPDLGPTLR